MIIFPFTRRYNSVALVENQVPGAFVRGGDEVGRHRGIDEWVVGEWLVVVGCQDKGESRVGFNYAIFPRSNPKGNVVGSEDVDRPGLRNPRYMFSLAALCIRVPVSEPFGDYL